jgi:hypothetical protein
MVVRNPVTLAPNGALNAEDGHVSAGGRARFAVQNAELGNPALVYPVLTPG